MSRIAYFRVSTSDQSIESQRMAMGGSFDQEFKDEGISGGTLAASRKGFGALLKYIRAGDTLYVYAVDRLGRDAIDVQSTVRDLLKKGRVSSHPWSGPYCGGRGGVDLGRPVAGRQHGEI